MQSGLPPIHSEKFLAEMLQELDPSQAGFARAIGVSPMRDLHVINHPRPVTAELALVGRALGQSPEYWVNLQATYDLRRDDETLGEQLATVTRLIPAWWRDRSRLSEWLDPCEGRLVIPAQAGIHISTYYASDGITDDVQVAGPLRRQG